MRIYAAFLIFILIASNAWASEDRYIFATPNQSQTFDKTVHLLRCVVCQNETLADSQAELAEDLRQEIAQQVRAGHTEQEILAFMEARYGKFVLYEPPLTIPTSFLWGGPFILLMVLLLILWRRIRQGETTST